MLRVEEYTFKNFLDYVSIVPKRAVVAKTGDGLKVREWISTTVSRKTELCK
jgi:hypothetical protein